ncbi:MAG: amino acid ABC transporter permease [Rickettsiales bacterium]|nr:amino acid ABC transporter permease [Rickettsiales bacterium]
MNLSSILYIIKGIPVTLEYTFISFLFGLCVGTIFSLIKISGNKWLSRVVSIYISIFRGTPILVQLTIVYFITPSLTGYRISIFEAGIIAFSLNSAAYITEIIRAGILSIDKGQFESARALGIPYFYIMKDIILPQAIKNILPALVNEIITLLKETAIISFFGEKDIMKRADAIATEQYDYVVPLLTAAACYYLLVVMLSNIAKFIEKSLKTS